MGFCGSQPGVRSAGADASVVGGDVLIEFTDKQTSKDCALALAVHLATRPRVVSVAPAPHIAPKTVTAHNGNAEGNTNGNGRRELLTLTIPTVQKHPAPSGPLEGVAGPPKPWPRKFGLSGGSDAEENEENEEEEGEEEDPARRQLENAWCSAGVSCYGATCDQWVNAGSHTCTDLEGYGCDCAGCACSYEAPPAPTASPNPTPAPSELFSCDAGESACFGASCDWWVDTGDYTCTDMEGYGCDCAGCQCGRYPTDAPTISPQPTPGPECVTLTLYDTWYVPHLPPRLPPTPTVCPLATCAPRVRCPSVMCSLWV